jgi:general secretion pathway protein G
MLAPVHLRRRPRGARAFTLLELLAVIAVLAVLTGIAIGVGRSVISGGRSARARAELSALTVALESYRVAHGDYPRTEVPARLLQSLLGRRGPDYAVVTGPAHLDLSKFSSTAGAGAVVADTAELLDPWGQPYRYAYRSVAPWTNPAYVLYSAGPDGASSAGLLPGGFPDVAAAGNADNLYATRP